MSPTDNRERVRRRAHADTVGAPDAAVRRIQRLIDDEIRRLPAADRSPVACAAGCAMCCHLRVMATPAEVFALADFIDRTFDSVARDALRERVRATAAQVAALPGDRVLKTNVACPVLVDGRCSAYAARPFNCRSYHSTDRTACQASFDAPDDLTLGHPQFVAVARVHEGAQGGFIAGLRDMGRDATQYELTTALDEAFRDPDARARDARGEPAFRKARRID